MGREANFGFSIPSSLKTVHFTDLFEWLFLGEVDHLLSSAATDGVHEDGSTLRPGHQKMVIGTPCNATHRRAMTL